MYDDDQDALAAEYVLGTLSADERDHAETLISIDPAFAAMVRQWERRLGELNVMVEAVEPPAEIWGKINAQVGGIEQPVSSGHHDQASDLSLLASEPAVDAPPVAMEPSEEPEEPSPVAALASSLLPPEEAAEFK